MSQNPPPSLNVSAVLNGITGAVTSLVKPLEELAAYYGVVGIGVVGQGGLPNVVRAVLAAFSALHIVGPKIAAAHKPLANASAPPAPAAPVSAPPA